MSETSTLAHTVRRERLWRRLLKERQPLWARIAFGAACGLVALLLRWPLNVLLGASLPFVLVFPALTIAAVWGGAAASSATVLVTVIYFVATSSTPRLDTARGLALMLFILCGGVITLVARELRLAVEELREQERTLQASDARLRLLVRELEHRVKNSLALAGALVKLTSRHSDDLADFRKRFEPRLQALAKAQTLLTVSDWNAPDLHALAEESLAPFLSATDCGVTIVPGPPFAVPVPSAVSLTLVLHELATNAVKHGALSAPGGRVTLSWTLSDAGATLEWVERGGLMVVPPQREGFGVELFRVLGQDAIKLDRRFDPQGVTCLIELDRC